MSSEKTKKRISLSIAHDSKYYRYVQMLIVYMLNFAG